MGRRELGAFFILTTIVVGHDSSSFFEAVDKGPCIFLLTFHLDAFAVAQAFSHSSFKHAACSQLSASAMHESVHKVAFSHLASVCAQQDTPPMEVKEAFLVVCPFTFISLAVPASKLHLHHWSIYSFTEILFLIGTISIEFPILLLLLKKQRIGSQNYTRFFLLRNWRGIASGIIELGNIPASIVLQFIELHHYLHPLGQCVEGLADIPDFV